MAAEISTTRSVSQLNLIRDRGQISKEIQHIVRYYKKVGMSNDKLSKILSGCVAHCDINDRNLLREKQGAWIHDFIDKRFINCCPTSRRKTTYTKIKC